MCCLAMPPHGTRPSWTSERPFARQGIRRARCAPSGQNADIIACIFAGGRGEITHRRSSGPQYIGQRRPENRSRPENQSRPIAEFPAVSGAGKSSRCFGIMTHSPSENSASQLSPILRGANYPGYQDSLPDFRKTGLYTSGKIAFVWQGNEEQSHETPAG